jgi:Co/Zn/Cd efflux system component
MSFGYHRFELLGAIGNLFIIWALALFLIYEATNRIIDQVYVQHPNVMLIVATLGLPVNIIMYFVLHTGGSHSHGLMSEECGGEELEEVGTSLCTDVLCENI